MLRKRIGFTVGHFVIAAVLVLIGLLPAQSDTLGQVLTPAPIAETGAPVLGLWSEPRAFDRNGWFPDITADASGRIHVAWSNSVIYSVGTAALREGFDIVLYTTSADNGVTWSTINEVAALKQGVVGSVEVTRPSMAVSQTGVLHMTFRDINVHYSNASAQAASDAQYWTKMQQVTTFMGYFSKVAVDSQGRVHMFFTENVSSSDCLSCYHLFYRYSDDGGETWSNEADISVQPNGVAKPNILIDSQDNIHVVWEAGRGGTLGMVSDPATVQYAVSYNRGESWSQPLTVGSEETERANNITIGQDGFGNILMVWWGLPNDLVYYQVSADNGLSWSKPTSIPNIWGSYFAYQGRQDSYSMAMDSAGNLHLVLVGRTASAEMTLRLLHMVWNGTVWAFPDVIVSYTGDVPEWPRIAVSNGDQLNVVWFVRGEDFIWSAAGDAYKIWYTNTKVNAPHIEPVEFPQPVLPTVVMRATPVIIDTPTPLPMRPTLEGTRDLVIPEETIYSETSQLTVLARSLIPALILVGLLMIGIVIKKR